MNKQRGFLETELIKYGAIAIGLILAVTGLMWAVTSYLTHVEQKGYERGKNEVISAYETRDALKLKQTLELVDRLQKEAVEKDAAHAKKLAEIEGKRLKEKQDAQRQKDADIAAVDGGFRLRDPKGGTCTTGRDPSPKGEASPSTPSRDGETGTELSAETSRFLLGLVNEADDITRQLADAQAVIEEDRRLCN